MSTHTVATGPQFRTDIQGLRAIAVLSVLIFHTFPELLPGGFTGVDVFFVISGYLISRIIIRETNEGIFSVAEFYRRRARRIFPALVAVLAFSIAVGWVLLSPAAFKELGRTTISSVLFVSNIDHMFLGGYFSGFADLKPLLHTWSLSVEEQFYLFFPPVLYLLWRHARERVSMTMLAVAALSLACAHVLIVYRPYMAFYFTPGRGVELLTGALLAIGRLPGCATDRQRDAVSVLGLTLIAAPVFLYSKTTTFPGVAALIPCLGTALVIHAGHAGTSLVGRLISKAPFQEIGKLSYSLYLWHWPVLSFARHLYGIDLPPIIASIAVLLSLVLAHWSYRHIEQPFLRPRGAALPYLRWGAVTIMTFSAMGAALVLNDGYPQRYSPQALIAFKAAEDFNRQRDKCHTVGNHKRYEDNCTYGPREVRPDVVVWGDSHASEIAGMLGERAIGLGRSLRHISASSCPPSLNFDSPGAPNCRAHNEQTLAALIADNSVTTVVLAANAYAYLGFPQFERGYEEVVTALAAHKTVVLIGQVPLMRNDPPSEVGRAIQWNLDLSAVGLRRSDYDADASKWNDLLTRLQAKLAVRVISPADALCDSAFCRAADDQGRSLYFDPSHLGMRGAALLVERISPVVYGPAN